MEILIAFLFMVLDILSGTLASIKTQSWKSQKMREGLFHKAGIILTIVGAVLIDYAQTYVDLGFNVPVLSGVILYICVMESGSVWENIKIINPDMANMRKEK